MNTVADIRQKFLALKANNALADDGNLELINASFIADEPTIFGEVNADYIRRELKWYLSQSLSVNDIPAPVPKVWQQVASSKGLINSNYGYLIWSSENGQQFENAIRHLVNSKVSRQALMVYTRPSIHWDAFEDGMRDFICTNTVQLMIRNNMLHYMVDMRSNDVVFGYRNDCAWHDYVFELALHRLQQHYPDLEKGLLFWNASSLHVYPRHFDLVI